MLEKHLKTLGQRIRIEILKKLKNNREPISFSRLQKEVISCNSASVNFSFHLNALKDCNLIESSEGGYFITVLGKQILNSVLSIEQILVEKNRVKMIRTSKYSKERFDINKIEKYLIKEGGMEPFIAKQIAHEVEERLSKTKIEYLTAPLMREYINAILLENGYEEIRHKLTRLGTPPFEVFKLFNSERSNINPEKFIKKLGSDVSEQFLLLNLLPKNLADFYLTGEIALLHLNYWSLRPLSLYFNTKSVLEFIIKRNSLGNLTNSRELIKLILQFIDLLRNFKPYFSQDLVLGDFNINFLLDMNSQEEMLHFIDILKSQILNFNNSSKDLRHSLTLEFSYQDLPEGILNQFKIDREFLNYKIRGIEIDNNRKPFINFDYSNLENIILDDIVSILKKNNICFYNNKSSNFLNSASIKIKNSKENQIILDKILINLHSISVKANRNDDLFLDLLYDKINCVFDLFKHKEALIKKKLNSLNGWKRLIHDFFEKVDDVYKNTIKSVSFFGLNKAILNHCGIELDRLENSEEFALRILSFMKKLIREKNQEENNYYFLSQPHDDTYLNNGWYNGTNLRTDMAYKYSPSIIRQNSKLSLNKKINIFKKFQKVINGGIIFDECIDNNGVLLKKLLSTLFKSELDAILIKNRIKF